MPWVVLLTNNFSSESNKRSVKIAMNFLKYKFSGGDYGVLYREFELNFC